VPGRPEDVYGRIAQSRDRATILGTEGRAVRYADGTIELYFDGGRRRYTLRPDPNGTNAYWFYDDNGELTPGLIVAIDPSTVF
jgi:hypothetical protein